MLLPRKKISCCEDSCWLEESQIMATLVQEIQILRFLNVIELRFPVLKSLLRQDQENEWSNDND